MLITAAVFTVVLVMVYGAYWTFVVRPESESERAVKVRLKGARTNRIGLATKGLLKTRENLSSLPVLDVVLARWGKVTDPLRVVIGRSGLKTTVGTLVMSAVFLCVLTTAGFYLASNSSAFALLMGLLVASVPFLYVKRVATKRSAKFEEQFPEAIDLIARALRAGHAMPTALQMAGEEMADPVGAEFRMLFEQQNYGMPLPEALRAFGDRVQLLDARFFVTTVLTQRETGGNMSEVLDRLSAVIRERFKVRRQVRVVSAHGRITGVVLGFLPPTVAGILLLISPEHIRLLVDDPLGVYMLGTALFLQVLGVMIIRRIVDVEY